MSNTIQNPTWRDIENAYYDAQNLIDRVNRQIKSFAKIVAQSDMKSISPSDLRKMKKKLSKYNMHTGEWKD